MGIFVTKQMNSFLGEVKGTVFYDSEENVLEIESAEVCCPEKDVYQLGMKFLDVKDDMGNIALSRIRRHPHGNNCIILSVHMKSSGKENIYIGQSKAIHDLLNFANKNG